MVSKESLKFRKRIFQILFRKVDKCFQFVGFLIFTGEFPSKYIIVFIEDDFHEKGNSTFCALLGLKIVRVARWVEITF